MIVKALLTSSKGELNGTEVLDKLLIPSHDGVFRYDSRHGAGAVFFIFLRCWHLSEVVLGRWLLT